MATRAAPELIEAIRADRRSGLYTDAEIAERNGVSRQSVIRHGRGIRAGGTRPHANARYAANVNPAAGEPELPRSEAGEPEFPPPLTRPFVPLQIDLDGWAGVVGDVHAPFHDEKALRAAVKEMRGVGIRLLLLNGDILDMRGVSPFYREPDEVAVVGEIEAGRKLLRWLRWQFPDARVVYREGNHEFRLRRFIAEKAKELFGLPGTTLPELLGLGDLKIEWVQDKRLIRIGKLNTLHGHELSKGGGVNPARYAFLKTTDTVMVGHWHQTSNHTQRTLGDKQITTWSVGCLCALSPDYAPFGQANHGFALVHVDRDGSFQVRNHRVRDGRIE